ncbi:hypothetical protein GCM10023329_44250 [Streptomyces sanyensis]|uniref:Uncharacterized protein n=1 Tax=Streptomyces sanyensis TaxID=568869 RepID=A0ABP9B1A8_9ACTN
MNEAPIDLLRRWADSLPPVSDEVRELACEMGDTHSDDVPDHPLWPVYVALFRAETGADPKPDGLSVICDCAEHF